MPGPVRSALRGRIVTMDARNRVHGDGVIYIEDNRIVAVAAAVGPAPPGFDDVRVQHTRGTLYPGLIDLHNHLCYNILPLWQVPRRYSNRDAWGRHPDYRRLISGPMNVLGQTPGYPEAIARFAECKCLLGGVTTSQGIALFSNAGMRRYYAGLLRNAEISDGPGLPAALARIADVTADGVADFLERLQDCSCMLLHLSEGTDARARKHFQSLALDDGRIAITGALSGIHCLALQAADFRLLARHGGSMVWSPLSNLLLYGSTADIAAAKRAGVAIALGSDWSPSGSKSLLGELKAAHACNAAAGKPFKPVEIVAMATRNPARMLKWDGALGTLEGGKRADVLVLRGDTGDPYLQLIRARETAISLVVIDGVRRYGVPSLMPDDARLETWRVGGLVRRLDLRIPETLSGASRLGLRESVERLRKGLRTLPALARKLENPKPARKRAGPPKPQWFLELEHEEPEGLSIRPRLQAGAPVKLSQVVRAAAAAGKPLSELLDPLQLDPLTMPDDASFLARIQTQANLPVAFKTAFARAFA